MPHSEPASPHHDATRTRRIGKIWTPSAATFKSTIAIHHDKSAFTRRVNCNDLHFSRFAFVNAERIACTKVAPPDTQWEAHVRTPTNDSAALTSSPPFSAVWHLACKSRRVASGMSATIRSMSYTTPSSFTHGPGPTFFSCLMGNPHAAHTTSNLRTASAASASESATKMKSST